MKSRIVLLAGAIAIAHYNGFIPHEEWIMHWCSATFRQGSRRLKQVVLTRHWGNSVTSLLEETPHLGGSVYWSRLKKAALAFSSSPRPAPAYVGGWSANEGGVSPAPPCNLRQLNDEYVALLAAHRRRVSPRAPAPRYDPVLFAGAFRFAQILEVEQTLWHDPTQPCAEMCGTSSATLSSDPKVLAQFIWSSFANSPHHAEIQADERLVFASVAATGHKFVVRLNYHPTAPSE